MTGVTERDSTLTIFKTIFYIRGKYSTSCHTCHLLSLTILLSLAKRMGDKAKVNLIKIGLKKVDDAIEENEKRYGDIRRFVGGNLFRDFRKYRSLINVI